MRKFPSARGKQEAFQVEAIGQGLLSKGEQPPLDSNNLISPCESARHELKGLSSYSELLKDMVEDEFELTCNNDLSQMRNKVTLKPFELQATHNVTSCLQESVFSCFETGPRKLNPTPFLWNGLADCQQFNP